jgi:hypothetical protein
MTKYFDKLLKIKFYISCCSSHGKMKTNAILEHVDFFEIHWISLIKIYFIIECQKIHRKYSFK